LNGSTKTDRRGVFFAHIGKLLETGGNGGPPFLVRLVPKQIFALRSTARARLGSARDGRRRKNDAGLARRDARGPPSRRRGGPTNGAPRRRPAGKRNPEKHYEKTRKTEKHRKKTGRKKRKQKSGGHPLFLSSGPRPSGAPTLTGGTTPSLPWTPERGGKETGTP